MTGERLAEKSNQSDVIRQDNERLEKWAKQVDEKAQANSETRFTERSTRHIVYENLWANTTPNAEFSESMKKLLNQKFERDLKLAHESKLITNYVDYPVQEKPAYQHSDESKKDHFFLPTEVIRKLLEVDNNNKDDGTGANSGAKSSQNENNLVDPNAMVKYMCSHKHLNPFAINKLKVVSRRGLELLKEKLGVDWHALALPAYDTGSTLCRQCVLFCLEYVKLREVLKNEAKRVRTLLQQEHTDENDEYCGSESDGETNLPASKLKQQHNNENDDVLIIEEKSSPPPSSSSSCSQDSSAKKCTSNGDSGSKSNILKCIFVDLHVQKCQGKIESIVY